MPYDAEKAGDVKKVIEKLKKTYKNVSDTAARQAIHVFNSVMDSTGDEGKAWASVYSKMNERGLSKNARRHPMSKTLTASERATLLRYASSLPKGNETRRAILAAFGNLASSRMELPISLEVKIEGLQDHPTWRDIQKTIAEASRDKWLDPDVQDDLQEVWKHIQESRAALGKAMSVLERM